MDTLITVKKYGSRIEAEIAKGLLESEGLKVIIFADDAGGYYPPSIMSGVLLKVDLVNLGKAQQLLGLNQSDK